MGFKSLIFACPTRQLEPLLQASRPGMDVICNTRYMRVEKTRPRREPNTTKHRPDVGPMLIHRLRRWLNIDQTLRRCVVYAGKQCKVREWRIIRVNFLSDSGRIRSREDPGNKYSSGTKKNGKTQQTGDIQQNGGVMLRQRRRRWTTITGTFGKRTTLANIHHNVVVMWPNIAPNWEMPATEKCGGALKRFTNVSNSKKM